MSISALETNAQLATFEMVEALESLIACDGAKAVVYGNSAIAAVVLIFQRYQVDIPMNRELFLELWAPITGSQALLSSS